jgi:hypothetical protein
MSPSPNLSLASDLTSFVASLGKLYHRYLVESQENKQKSSRHIGKTKASGAGSVMERIAPNPKARLLDQVSKGHLAPQQ